MTMYVMRNKYAGFLFITDVNDRGWPIHGRFEDAIVLSYIGATNFLYTFVPDSVRDNYVIQAVEVEEPTEELYYGNSIFNDSRLAE